MLYSSEDHEIEAWVETLDDKQRFAEHRETSGDDEVTGKVGGKHQAYLECEEGKTFSIKFRNLRPANTDLDMSIGIEIDGRRIRGKAWWKKDSINHVSRMYVKEDSTIKVASLAFATLPKTDEEEHVQIKGQAAIAKLGKIVIRIRQGAQVLDQRTRIPRGTESQVGLVHEKQLKLGSTIQAVNTREWIPDRRSYTFVPSVEKEPFVCSFVWNYHTKDKLSIMGIIKDDPRPAQDQAPPIAPAPLPSLAIAPIKRELEAEHDDEPELVIKRVKKEKKGLGSEEKPIIVPEGYGPIPGMPGGGGVIDLTFDD